MQSGWSSETHFPSPGAPGFPPGIYIKAEAGMELKKLKKQIKINTRNNTRKNFMSYDQYRLNLKGVSRGMNSISAVAR